MKSITIEGSTVINNLYKFLKETDADTIVIRTTLVKGGWYDNEADANAAGFNITRFINPEYIARHEFAECYRLTRRRRNHHG